MLIDPKIFCFTQGLAALICQRGISFAHRAIGFDKHHPFESGFQFNKDEIIEKGYGGKKRDCAR